MVDLSPYADAESGSPSWRVGERESAIVLLSLTLYIILDVNVAIYRVFRKKQGLYYWSLIFATWGTATVALGNIFKNLKPEWGVIWPLWTLMINGGWSVYAPAELLILYSRLHLVNQNERLHRWLLMMIIVGSTLIIIPNWVFVFGAYDIDPKVSSVWSPRMAIIDRVSQAGFTLFETVISGVYISSLLEILRTKITTRTRRVMRDLIFVNVLVISMDLLVIILIFLNQANLAYPLQDFTYAFKFKIEFAVLNQLMAVAASGSRQITFEDRRYRKPGQTTMLKGYSDDDLNGVRLPFLSMSTDSKASPQGTLINHEALSGQAENTAHTTLSKPAPSYLKEKLGMSTESLPGEMQEVPAILYDNNFSFAPGPDLDLCSQTSSRNGLSSSKEHLHAKNSEDTLLAPVADDGNDLTLAMDPPALAQQQHRKKEKRISLRRVVFGKQNDTAGALQLKSNGSSAEIDHHTTKGANSGLTRNRIAPFEQHNQQATTPSANQKAGSAKTGDRPAYRRFGSRHKVARKDADMDDDEDGVHVWERPGSGRAALEAPWFRRHEAAVHDNAAIEKRV